MSNFATMIFVGPGEEQTFQLREVLDSLLYYEPDVAKVILIDDASSQDFDSLIPEKLQLRTVILENPRRGRSYWREGGQCVALCAGLKHLAQNVDFDFLVRLDTDALVINPFADRIRDKYKAHENAGLLGTWDQYPFNAARRLPHSATHHILEPVLEKASRRFAVWRHSDWPTRIQSVFSADDRLVRRLILTAQQRGYQLGYYHQGGAYSVRSDVIRAVDAAGFLSESAYLYQLFSEDVLMTLFCFAAEHQPVNFNDPGDVFSVQSLGIGASPETLVEHNYAILHTYKNDEKFSQQEIIEFFRRRRV